MAAIASRSMNSDRMSYLIPITDIQLPKPSTAEPGEGDLDSKEAHEQEEERQLRQLVTGTSNLLQKFIRRLEENRMSDEKQQNKFDEVRNACENILPYLDYFAIGAGLLEVTRVLSHIGYLNMLLGCALISPLAYFIVMSIGALCFLIILGVEIYITFTESSSLLESLQEMNLDKLSEQFEKSKENVHTAKQQVEEEVTRLSQYIGENVENHHKFLQEGDAVASEISIRIDEIRSKFARYDTAIQTLQSLAIQFATNSNIEKYRHEAKQKRRERNRRAIIGTGALVTGVVSGVASVVAQNAGIGAFAGGLVFGVPVVGVAIVSVVLVGGGCFFLWRAYKEHREAKELQKLVDVVDGLEKFVQNHKDQYQTLYRNVIGAVKGMIPEGEDETLMLQYKTVDSLVDDMLSDSESENGENLVQCGEELRVN